MNFGVIVADPNWGYQNWTDKAHGAAKAHYPGASSDDIARVPVASWSAEDCVLALWATLPKLTEALSVLTRWGFEYVTAIPWVKTVPSTGRVARGVGFWSMGCAELLLIGRRGNPRSLLPRSETPLGLLVDEGVFYAPRRKHSQKPDDLQTWLERRHSGPYLELYATRERSGWTCWGTNTGYRLSERGVELDDPSGRTAEGGLAASGAQGEAGGSGGGGGDEGGGGDGRGPAVAAVDPGDVAP